jgi:hypothetical protein
MPEQAPENRKPKRGRSSRGLHLPDLCLHHAANNLGHRFHGFQIVEFTEQVLLRFASFLLPLTLLLPLCSSLSCSLPSHLIVVASEEVWKAIVLSMPGWQDWLGYDFQNMRGRSFREMAALAETKIKYGRYKKVDDYEGTDA